MKYNLMFTVIPHSNGHEENTDVVLREFLNSELGISDANEIPFQNVHRAWCGINSYGLPSTHSLS
jgi:hypothetical protein